MCEVARANQLSRQPKEMLPKEREFAYPWHWVFPPMPGHKPGGLVEHPIGRKDPFPWQDQLTPEVLAPRAAFTV
jgi:hypothetical protein